jgi:hypothetical protein
VHTYSILVAIFFLNTIFNLKGNCVLRTLKVASLFFERDTYNIHTRLGQINSATYLKRPKCKPLGNILSLIRESSSSRRVVLSVVVE